MTKPWTCPKCKAQFEYSQPRILDGCTGYTTPAHECGDGFTAMRLKPKSKDAKAFWGKVRDKLTGAKP